MKRDSFVFYRGFFDAMNELQPAEQLALVRMICDYALNESEPETGGAIVAIFRAVKGQIDANNKRFEDGVKGGRPKSKNKKPVVSDSITSGFESENQWFHDSKPVVSDVKTSGYESENQWLGENVNVDVNVNENVNVDVNEDANVVVGENVHGKTTDTTTTTTQRDNKTTSLPTLEQLKIWCRINGINTNLEKFYAYNEARGWTLNGKPAEWQALLKLWCANDKDKGRAQDQPAAKYDYDAIERELVNKI